MWPELSQRKIELQNRAHLPGALPSVAPHVRSHATPFGIPQIDQHLTDGGLVRGHIHEFAPKTYGDYAAALGFLLCLIRHMRSDQKSPLLWCSPGQRLSLPHMPYPHGLTEYGLTPDDLICVEVDKEKEMLWVLEEALASAACPYVLGLYTQEERDYNFTASRRLSLRAEKQGGTLFLLRHHHSSKSGNSTAAATRWSIAAAPSAPIRYQNRKSPAPGRPRWHVFLSRCKRGRPGHWMMEWDHETFSFRLVSPLVDRTLPSLPTECPARRLYLPRRSPLRRTYG